MSNKKLLFKTLLFLAFLLYLSLLFYLVFLSPYYGRQTFHQNFNLVPFKTIFRFLNYSQSKEAIATNILGNIIAFLPLGILLPLLFKSFRKFSILVLVILSFTLFIEIIQYLASIGIGDIDDIILNLAGGVFGFFIFKITNKFRNS